MNIFPKSDMPFTEISLPLNATLKVKKENNRRAIKNIAKNLCFILLNPNNNQIAIIRIAMMNSGRPNTIINETTENIKIFLLKQKLL